MERLLKLHNSSMGKIQLWFLISPMHGLFHDDIGMEKIKPWACVLIKKK